MTARTHDLAAAVSLLLVATVAPLPPLSLATILLCFLGNQIGGILPDIDQPTAPLWRNLPIGHVVGKLVGRSLGGHRFLTHSLLGLGLFGVLVRLLLGDLTPLLHHANTGYIWWSFIIGMASHLCMDTLTKEGVPWLLPVPIKFGLPPLRRLRITSGSWVEATVIFPLLLLAAIWLVAGHYPQLSQLLQSQR